VQSSGDVAIEIIKLSYLLLLLLLLVYLEITTDVAIVKVF